MNKTLKTLLVSAALSVSMLSLAACSSSDNAKKSTKSNNTAKVQVKKIETKELKENLGKNNWVVVDTRVNDAFNGWKLEGVKRGGHIKGATDFSANWLNAEDPNKNKEKRLEEALKTKNITKDKNVVLYDANGKDAKEVAAYLSEKGIKNIYTYNIKEWAEDESLPMENYENYQMLVPVSWVKDLIDGKKTETYNSKEYKIFEVSWGDETKSPDYLKTGHIKGATHINTDEVEEGPLWNRRSDKELKKFAEGKGITVDTTVILYGTDSMSAYRVATTLKYLGVKDVRVINGGLAAWKNAEYELEKDSNKATQVSEFGAKVPVNKNYIVDLPEAKKIIADKKGSKLVDIRSWDEFIGKISGYDYIKPKGRPAGAAWGHAGSDAMHLEDYRNVDNTMLNKSEILAMWKEWGITPDQKLSFYCGTGWRAAEVLFYADVMGLKNISLYDGGWNEWSGNTGNPKNPVETGEPKRAK